MTDARLETLLLDTWEVLEAPGEGTAGCVKGCCPEDGAADPLSSIDGSVGGGPSSAHLRDSYLDRINDSNLL